LVILIWYNGSTVREFTLSEKWTTKMKITEYDDRTEWTLNGKLHRKYGPAYEGANGEKVWFLNGEQHREDGAAVEAVDGTKAWFLKDKKHREDGPAVEYADGSVEWWLNDQQVTEDIVSDPKKQFAWAMQIASAA